MTEKHSTVNKQLTSYKILSCCQLGLYFTGVNATANLLKKLDSEAVGISICIHISDGNVC